MKIIQNQYKNLNENKHPNKRRKKKGKKSKSSIWLKSHQVSSSDVVVEQPLKSLLEGKIKTKELIRTNLSQLKSPKHLLRNLQTKKVEFNVNEIDFE